MVVIHIKKGDEGFLYEATTQTPMSDIYPEITAIHNARKRIQRLVSAVKDLIEYGPLKPEKEQGYSEEQLEELSLNETPIKRASFIQDGFEFHNITDPTGRRIGQAVGEEGASIITKTLAQAELLLSAAQILTGKVLKLDALMDAFNTIKGAVTIVYPRGLPECEVVRDILEDNEDLTGSAVCLSNKQAKDVLDPKEAALWWAGKELVWEKKLSDFVGKNEKTKIIGKLQKKGSGPPVREPTISEAEQKNMMAYYHRKQEAHKRLDENTEDDYLNSSWADNGSLKKNFNGMSQVKFKPF